MKQEFDTIEDLLGKVHDQLLQRQKEIERDILDCEIALQAVKDRMKPPLFPDHIVDANEMAETKIVVAEMVDENNLHSYLHTNKPI
jgi:uncharacterized protein (DUF2164 family)